ncbi:ParD-like family protein [Fibrobacterota bacterium]
MGTAVRISEDLVEEAKVISRVENRSITGQIEHWAKVGKIAEDNPDLTFKLIKEILIGVAELENGQGVEYKFG